MQDHLHAYNVKIAEARRQHREAVRRASDQYDLAVAPLAGVYEANVDLAARIYRNAVTDAEDAYSAAVLAAEGEPPF